MYELREQMATVTDSAIEKQLKTHADDVTLKQTAIKELQNVTKEYEWEHKQVQQAAAQFGLFLKRNSLSPINDATIAYIDFLIAAEKDKIEAGGNKQKLRALEADRREYLETIKVLTVNMESNANFKALDEEGVSRLVKELYKLKHFGKNLQSVKNVVATAHQATYRERPYRVQRTNPSYSRSLFHGIFGQQQPHSHHGGIPHATPMVISTMRSLPSNLTLDQAAKRKSGMGWFGKKS